MPSVIELHLPHHKKINNKNKRKVEAKPWQIIWQPYTQPVMSASMNEIDDFLSGPLVAWVSISAFLHGTFLVFQLISDVASMQCTMHIWRESLKCPYAAFVYLHTSDSMSRRHRYYAGAIME